MTSRLVGRPFQLWLESPPPIDLAPILAGRAIIAGVPGSTSPNMEGLEEANGIIASAGVRYDDALMDRCRQLRVISRTGIGVDNIDIEAATRRGIAVCIAPDGPTVSTAEHAMALIFAVAKRLSAATEAFRDGRYDLWGEHDAIELDGRSLGLVGFGRIGRRVAGMAVAVGLRVSAVNLGLDPTAMIESGVRPAPSLAELLGSSDIVSLHAPLTPATHHLINADRLAQMRRGSILINTARGGLVDEAALLAALDRGHLSGAGLDVFDPEPPIRPSPFGMRRDVVATPHFAAATAETRERLWRLAIESALAVLSGTRPPHMVNSEGR
jgi:phosphoglycerate dehydrogenase-like enzyme